MADECDLETVKDFILSKGGKIRNADLVTRYRKFLDNPAKKSENREKFKDIVNTLATIKKDESGDKVLVLKKKFRGGSSPTEATSTTDVRAQSEPPTKVARESDNAKKDSSPPRAQSEGAVTSSTKTSSDTSMAKTEEEKADLANMSVKERAQHLNKIESQSQLDRGLANKENNNTHKRKDKVTSDGDDDSQCGYVSLGPQEREWLITCSSSDYMEMAKLLNQKPALVKIRDITNTALHWAAKHGKPEVVKLIAGSKQGVNVDQRSGYTALHLAAMHGHEDIIEILVGVYHANPNIRDYGGKKAKHYLHNSATNRSQQIPHTELLVSRQHPDPRTITTSLSSESFLRSASFRKSRSKALSSLMSSQFGIKAQPIVRMSWEGSDGEGEVFDARTTPPNSGKPSPQVRRKGSLQLSGTDNRLMPPPSGTVRRKKNKSGSRETSPGSSHFSRTGSDPNLRSPSLSSKTNLI